MDLQDIEVEQKCIVQKKLHDNESDQRENASVPDNKDDKNKRARIIAEARLKRRVADLEHHIQHLKAKAY